LQEDGYDGPQVEQNLREVRDVGATWVELTPTWSQESRTSNEVVRTPKTVGDAGLERAITLAHQYGLKVFLKPHIDLPNPGQDSRNNILPGNREAWFTSYTAFITHYAAMAERLGVEQFAMATELSSLTEDRSAWLQVIRAVRAQYHGTVLYAAGRDYARVPFWDALDMIGIDAYWPLSMESTTDVQALQQAWEPYRDELADLAAKYNRQIVFTEAGFTSQEGTTTEPSDWRISDTANQTEQAAGYQSLLATFSDQPWWAGVYWWVWNMLPSTAAEPRDYSPRGKAAEWVIRGWWAT
jgi:Glycoside Hydrolase Family 113